MADVGSACLAIAPADGALRGRPRRSYGARSGRREWVDLGPARDLLRSPACCVTAFVILEAAFLRSDFSFALVAQDSSTDTPTFYKVTAMWSTPGRVAAAVGDAAVALLERGAVPHAPLAARDRAVGDRGARRGRGLLPPADGLLREPVRHARRPRREGAGLNPLLRHPAMMFHPPMLYTGYVGFSIPFAFAIGALITRRTGADWIRATRRFALIAWTFLGIGHPARRALVVHRARLGRLLGLGPGRERVADAVAGRHRVPALDHGAGEARDAEGLERVADLRDVRAGAARDVPGALAASSTRSTPSAPRRSACRSWSSSAAWSRSRPALIVARLPDLRSEARLDSLLSREAVLPAQQPGAGRPLLRDLVGHVLPADLGGDHRHRVERRARRGSTADTMPLALVLVLLTGIGPVLAWRRVTPRALRRDAASCRSRSPASRCVALLAFTDATDSVPSLLMFTLRRLRARRRGAGVLRAARARGA